ncbi:MAG: DUF1800 domain-containing protein [Candidatus Binatia bacterium]
MSAPLSQEQKVIHYLNRTSFGPTREEVARVERMGIRAHLDEQLRPQTIDDNLTEEKLAGLKTMRLSSRELIELYPPPQVVRQQANQPGMMARQEMQAPRMIIFELQQARLLRSIYSQRQLFEVMVDFWTNHFNVFSAKGADRWLTTSYDRDTIRPNALGKFKDILLATAKSPAMLFYLDNWMSASPDSPGARFAAANNRRRGLNENYARELMELHTVGVDGGYTQKDVVEVARCFTGWTIRQPQQRGEFVFEPRIHDNGEKIVMGTRIAPGGGMDDGLRVIELLSRHPATARFISLKLTRRFIADDPPPAIVSKAADAFRQSDGDIPTLLRTLIDAPEFFAPEFYLAKIKKPLEFVASALRATGAETQMSHQLLRYVGRMGEPLFLALPPTGFPDAASSWISPDMLLTRMNFAADLVSNRLPGSKVAPDRVKDKNAFLRLIAPDGLSPSTRAVLDESDGQQAIALAMAAPEFQRR